MSILLDLMPPRLMLFLVGVGLIVLSIYGFGRAWGDSARIDDILGPEGETVRAVVSRKWELQSTGEDGKGETGTTWLTNMEVEYTFADQDYSVALVSSSTPFAGASEGDTVEFRLHPADPEFLVHPQTEPRGAFLHSIPSGIAFILGVIVVMGVIISLL